MNVIYLKKHPVVQLKCKGKYVFENNNSGKLQTIFWDGTGLEEELLGVDSTRAITEKMGKT